MFDDRIEFDHAVVSEWDNDERVVIRYDKNNRYIVTNQHIMNEQRVETTPEYFTNEEEALTRFYHKLSFCNKNRFINRLDLFKQKK